jgi:hypothetical protein
MRFESLTGRGMCQYQKLGQSVVVHRRGKYTNCMQMSVYAATDAAQYQRGQDTVINELN